MADWSRWEAIRQRGRVRYILVSGLLIRGIPMAAFYATSMWALHHGEFQVLILRALLFFPLLGMLAAGYWWWCNERAYSTQKPSGNP